MNPRKARFPSRRTAMAAAASLYYSEYEVILGNARIPRPYEVVEGNAVVHICGPLEQHEGWLFDNYHEIHERVEAAFACDVQRVILCIDSPGGDFAGAIELAREIREMADAARKPLFAYTDSSALSAAYAIACAADEIVVTPSGFVGSVGVWCALCDETAKNRGMGLNIAIVSSGTRKVDKNPDVPISEDAIEAAQVQVDGMASLLFDWVAKRRPASREAIEGLQGAEVFGSNALDLQLADRIVNSWGELLSLTKETVMPKPAAKTYDETVAEFKEAMSKYAKDDQETIASAAKKMLDKMSAEDEMPEKKKDEDGEKAEADDEKMSAEAEDDEKKAAAKTSSRRMVAASVPQEMALARELHALKAEIARDKESAKRKSLLEGRPDFSASIVETLNRAPIELVEQACRSWPRGDTPAATSAAAMVPGGTRGVSAPVVTTEDENFIAKHMGGLKAMTGIKKDNYSLTLGSMSQDEAREYLARLEKENQ